MEKLENLRLRSPLNSVHMFSSSVISSWKITVKRGNLSKPISDMSRVSCGTRPCRARPRAWPGSAELLLLCWEWSLILYCPLMSGGSSLEIAYSSAHLPCGALSYGPGALVLNCFGSGVVEFVDMGYGRLLLSVL